MKRKNNKGIGLIELLIVIAVGAVIAPLLFRVFSFGIKSYSSYNKYIGQHYTAMEVTQRIRKDIEEAAAYKVVYNSADYPITDSILTLWIPDGDSVLDRFSVRIWKVSGGSLYFKSLDKTTIDDGKKATSEATGYSEVLSGLDTTTIAATPTTPNYMLTRFEYIGTNKQILLSIKPVAQNTVVSKNRNVNKPVVTEFCVRYKDKIN